jgi:L-serine dehydratase
MRTSIFDLFKIGIGPSSSHTVGPMVAARRFMEGLGVRPTRVKAELYGSLALTGVGHHTDKALVLGLCGERPESVALDRMDRREEWIELVFHKDLVLPGHPNAMRFSAYEGGRELRSEVWFSIGGGAVVREGEPRVSSGRPEVPHPFTSSAELLDACGRTGMSVWRVVLENEMAWRSEAEVREWIGRFWAAMQDCARRGLTTEGILPGGLEVVRRAPAMYARLMAGNIGDPLRPMDWLNAYAMAVNEENAAGGRVVTAPTNGAAGVVPAVAHYYVHLLDGDEEGVLRYFLAAAGVGVLYAENASISGAEVGCQGEVGVACSMAAAGLVSALEGSAEEVEHAAEIAMEHNLGMTCDPIGGLVQIPCIERNAFGAVKAVNAARMAMRDTGEHKVTLDQVIRTMHQTGLDMQSKYKETSLAGLAVNVVEC